MNIADKRFIRFISFIENYYELLVEESPNKRRLTFTTKEPVASTILFYSINTYLALKKPKFACKYEYRDRSVLTYCMHTSMFYAKTDHFKVALSHG